MQLVLVGLGGFAGAVLRWLVDGWVSERNPTAFPFGTLVMNLTGSFLLGVAVRLGRSSATSCRPTSARR